MRVKAHWQAGSLQCDLFCGQRTQIPRTVSLQCESGTTLLTLLDLYQCSRKPNPARGVGAARGLPLAWISSAHCYVPALFLPIKSSQPIPHQADQFCRFIC